MDTKTIALLDINAAELSTYFRNWRNAHPQADDYPQLMADAIAARWPLLSVEQCCRDAFRNSLEQSDEKSIRDAASDPESWVMTHPQGDLFSDSPDRLLPRQFIVRGQGARKYYEVSIVRAREWFAAKMQAKRAEAKAYEDARRAAEEFADQCAKTVAQLDGEISRAQANGLNPDEVFFAKVD